MLLLESENDTKQISVTDFAEMVGISNDIVEKLKKNPVFEINPTKTKPDKLNGGLIAPAGKGSKPYFFVEIKGIVHILRYYKSRVPDKVNPRITTYDPKRVVFEDQLSIYPELDHALFMYALPICQDSPTAQPDWHFRFQNKEKQAVEIRDNAAKISKALALVNNATNAGGLSDGEIMIVAKGIYAQNTGVKVIPNPSQKHKMPIEVRADLTQLIFKDVDVFLDSTDSDVNEFYGMVLDAVDRGIFAVEQSPNSSVKSWYWKSGPKKGNLIVDIQPGQNDFEALKGAIEADPNKYYQFVLKSVKEASGRENIAAVIKANKAQAARPVEPAPVDKPAPTAKSIEAKHAPEPAPADDDLFETYDDEDSENGEADKILGPPDDDEGQANTLDFEHTTNHEFGAAPDLSQKPASFVIPTNFNEAAKLLGSFNNGKFPNQQLNKKFYLEIKAGNITLENLQERAQNILAGMD